MTTGEVGNIGAQLVEAVPCFLSGLNEIDFRKVFKFCASIAIAVAILLAGFVRTSVRVHGLGDNFYRYPEALAKHLRHEICFLDWVGWERLLGLDDHRDLAIALNRRASAFRRGVQVDFDIGVQ
jgi:hypothetical protein